MVDAIVGNPPYVRRAAIQDVDDIRSSIFERDGLIGKNLSRLTDLCVYFLLYACQFLKVGGRLAVITADSWLDVGYGEGFKKYLRDNFEIERLIAVDRQVFRNTEVKPVLILATKTAAQKGLGSTYFVRLKNGLSIDHGMRTEETTGENDLICSRIQTSEMDERSSWSFHFKKASEFNFLASHKLMVAMESVAQTRIGVQTLAKPFFILSTERARELNLEPRFLETIALSLRYFASPVIESRSESPHMLFYCSDPKESLKGTNALAYILDGESVEVPIRGKATRVKGYHSKDRIVRSSRRQWYDLKTSIERRGRAAILIPRLIYKTYRVIWNKASLVPGELFIEFLPFSAIIRPEVHLAILSSSLTETMLRIRTHVYGGGTYNINPGQIGKTPVLNAEVIDEQQRDDLCRAYTEYVCGKGREAIDTIVYRILGIDERQRERLETMLKDLLLIATSAKKPHLANPHSV